MGYKPYEYLSDEDLEQFIQDIEQSELLKAPSYLKDEILMKVTTAPAATAASITTPVQAPRNPASEKLISQKKISLMIYSLKVSLAAAAAIVMLFMIPHQDNGELYSAPDGSRTNMITSQINEKSNVLCSKLFDFSNKLIFNDKNSNE